ncbi:hypothetical protein IQ251_12985 [Saccharopolyspora sp. HNM0983]|uniref:Secreted protein n=2 Tax=Saccharopolyspora montiporae TaxID=2781240 RepID=A0A929BAQ1_9PSEU|nr:hypothetical protein [Saccharopolyspora sp. HNM0983]
MIRSLTRFGTATCLAAAACLALGGVAHAAEEPPSAWLLPGVDIGPVVDPLVQLPTEALAPVVGVLDSLAP